MRLRGGDIIKSKYDNYYYWENVVNKDRFDNPFADDPITEESLFFHGVAIDCHGECYERWLHFPYIEASLGFLNYIFLPMAFYAFLSNGSELLTQGNLDEMLDIMSDSETCSQKDLIPQMRESSKQLGEIWNCCDSEKWFGELKKFSAHYNEHWNQGHELFSYLDVFKSPTEIGKFLVETY